MSSRPLLSAVALAMLAFLAACGGGEPADDSATGTAQASAVGGIGGSGATTQSVGGIGGSGATTHSVGGIGGSGATTQSVGGIGGSGATAQSVGGIGGSGATAQSVGGIGGSGIRAATAVQACGLRSVNVTVAAVRVNANGAADLGSAGWIDIALAAPVRIDLLALAAGGALPIDLSALPDGSYEQIRLLLVADDANAPLADSVVTAAQTETALAVPGAAQGGLPLAAAITVASGRVSASCGALDVCHAVTASTGGYALGAVSAAATQVASAY